ncbi:MAG: hypothetical protein EOP61_34780 [Sphingomonadales bacterium]|nr:MAG: hypothetical protein EOP61_34780 [Sphingomonadales bacterium]
MELEAPNICDEALRLIARCGIAMPAEILDRAFTLHYTSSPAVEAAWAEIYRAPDRYWDLYELAEKLVDLEYRIQIWRFGHLFLAPSVLGDPLRMTPSRCTIGRTGCTSISAWEDWTGWTQGTGGPGLYGYWQVEGHAMACRFARDDGGRP